ncbi:MAG: hypothetical protein Q7J27_09340 [Syntrophales bacterium]|nr:hypothetical protein [Syntrophales bacterium]
MFTIRNFAGIIAENSGGKMTHQAYLYISGCIFGVVAILHLIRAALQLPVKIGTLSFPVGLSWVGGVVTLLLYIWGFQLAAKGRG